MPTVIPAFRIEQEVPSQLHLVSADRRWVIVILAFLFIMPLVCFGVLAFFEDEIRLFGVASLATGLFFFAFILFIAPFKTQFIINSGMRTVTYNRFYMLGEQVRGKEWTFNEITDTNLVKQGFASVIELDINGKKAHRLNFGNKTNDAQRSYNILQSWLKGLVPDSNTALTALQEVADEKQIRQALKNAEKMLYYFGGFSLLGGALGFFADNALNSSISITTMISIFTGLIYLACGYGAKRKIEAALWVAIVVVIVERLYWFIMSGSLSGDGNWSSWLTWIFAIFVVSSLWQAIRSIRTMEENPVYEPLT
ncbi:MAG: hypothetical protein JW963_09335 [Anaerolineales bacterium]|nr:hypothetical protein [Anaerolineales bacterium]